MPSTRTSVWLELVPRRNRVLAWPGPPVRAMSTPAWRDQQVDQVGRLAGSMSARVSTVTEASTSSTATSLRVAVTMTGPSVVDVVCAWTAPRKGKADCRRTGRPCDANWFMSSPGTLTRVGSARGGGKRAERRRGEATVMPRRPPQRAVVPRLPEWLARLCPRPVSGLVSVADQPASIFRLPRRMPSGLVKDFPDLPLRGQRRTHTGFPSTWGGVIVDGAVVASASRPAARRRAGRRRRRSAAADRAVLDVSASPPRIGQGFEAFAAVRAGEERRAWLAAVDGVTSASRQEQRSRHW